MTFIPIHFLNLALSLKCAHVKICLCSVGLHFNLLLFVMKRCDVFNINNFIRTSQNECKEWNFYKKKKSYWQWISTNSPADLRYNMLGNRVGKPSMAIFQGSVIYGPAPRPLLSSFKMPVMCRWGTCFSCQCLLKQTVY